MSASNSPGGPGNSKGPSTLLKVGLAAVFLVFLAGASYLVYHTFVSQSSNTVILPQVASGGAAAPVTPGAPVQADPTAPLIGGLVNNDQGAGIPNVRVRLVWAPTPPANPGDRPVNITKDLHTDATGHWSYQGIPKEMLPRLNIMLTQNDYVTVSGRVTEVDKLLDQSLVQVMPRGLVVRGVVLDEQGQPVVGVKITAGNLGNRNSPTATSNTEGQFTMRHIPPARSVSMVAIMAGYAPSVVTVPLPPGKEQVKLVMTAGRTVTGQVVDKAGKPQAGVTVSVNQFQQMFMGGANGIRVTTDSQGKYTMPNAPLDTLQIVANKPGYTTGFEQLAAGTKTLDFTISPLLTMQGKVTDAVTGAPVSQFQVITGAKWANNDTTNFSMGGNSFSNGQYQQQLTGYSGEVDSWYVKIVAKGYLPAVSPALHDSGTQDFQLQPAKDLTGHVLDAEGNPVAGIAYAMAVPGQQLQIYDGQININGPRQDMPVTDAQGTYDLPPQTGQYMVVVAGPAGYGEADQDALAKSPDIHLTQWGRIEGTVIVNGKPGVDEQISGNDSDRQYDPQSPMVNFSLNARSDSQGHFTIERVPATDISISRLVQAPGQNYLTTAQSEQVTVTAGQTATVQIGGKGRPVVGQVEFPADASSWPDHQVNGNVIMKWDGPALPVPPEAQRTPGGYQKWLNDYRKTDAGKAYFKLASARKNYQLEIDADGKFRVEDVVAGTYDLNINIFPRQGGQSLAVAGTQFTMPPIPGGYSTDPLQIDKIVLKENRPLGIGDAAPAFSAKTLDGKQISLSDYQGKYVLVDIWMSTSGGDQTKPLKAVYDAYGKDDRFVMVGLSADIVPGMTDAYVKRNQMDWIQSVMTPEQTQTIAASYTIQEIPYVVLIGPDGKLLAAHLKDDAILAAVTKALGDAGKKP
jgi:hypothetical protein